MSSADTAARESAVAGNPFEPDLRGLRRAAVVIVFTILGSLAIAWLLHVTDLYSPKAFIALAVGYGYGIFKLIRHSIRVLILAVRLRRVGIASTVVVSYLAPLALGYVTVQSITASAERERRAAAESEQAKREAEEQLATRLNRMREVFQSSPPQMPRAASTAVPEATAQRLRGPAVVLESTHPADSSPTEAAWSELTTRLPERVWADVPEDVRILIHVDWETVEVPEHVAERINPFNPQGLSKVTVPASRQPVRARIAIYDRQSSQQLVGKEFRSRPITTAWSQSLEKTPPGPTPEALTNAAGFLVNDVELFISELPWE